MTTITAIVRNGQLELPGPINLPDGTKVEIRLPEREGVLSCAKQDSTISAAATAQQFRELADRWQRETGMYSSITKKLQHPAHRQIIAMGEKVLPLILRELREHPGHWFEALKAIAKESPVPAEERADPKMARAAWLKWGTERGLID